MGAPLSHGRVTAVFGSDIAAFGRNRAFDLEIMQELHGGALGVEFGRTARQAGFRVATADVFAGGGHEDPGLLVSDMGSGFGCPGIVPAVCWALESPVIAYGFYHDLQDISANFRHVFLWPGTRERVVSPGTTFHEIFWPNDSAVFAPNMEWHRRQLLVYVAANKAVGRRRGTRFNWHHPRSSLRAMGRDTWYIPRDPWLTSALVNQRRRAVLELSAHPEFVLHGQGWGDVPPADVELSQALGRCYRGELEPGTLPKLRALARFKFTLCLENTAFLGYVTEKVFDALRAGSVPVYEGAPDIARYVWPEAFIDARTFATYSEMPSALADVSPACAAEYLEAGREFLASGDYVKFTAHALAERVVRCLIDVRDHG